MSNAPSYSEITDRLHSEKPMPEERALELEISNVAENKIGNDGERIRASVALFTSKSIKELEGLTFELNGLQEFLKSETERVQREIDNALSGLKIIIDTISCRGETRVAGKFRPGKDREDRTAVAARQLNEWSQIRLLSTRQNNAAIYTLMQRHHARSCTTRSLPLIFIFSSRRCSCDLRQAVARVTG